MATSSVVEALDILARIDYLTLLLAIFGWIFALWLQKSNAKYEHRIQVRYEIYKLLLNGSRETQACLSKLGSAYTPLILMRSTMIPFDLKLKKEHKGILIPYSEQECVLEGHKKWTDHTKEVSEKYFAYTSQYREMLFVFEGWAAAIESLMPAQDVLYKEVNKLDREIFAYVNDLQMYSTKHGYDWRKWKKEDVEAISNNLSKKAGLVNMYISDFMALVHNELLSEHFKYKRPIRKTLDPQYKVLTPEGLVVRLQDDYEEKLRQALRNVENEK